MDPDNRISESNDNNNTRSLHITIAPVGGVNDKSDLIITNISQELPIPIQSRSGFFVTIRNQGLINAVFPRGMKYMANQLDNGEWNGITSPLTITIPPGQTYTGKKYAGATTAGTYSVTFKVDHEDLIIESDDDNNESTVSYTILPAP